MATLVRCRTTAKVFLDAFFSAYMVPYLRLHYGKVPVHDALLQKILLIFRILIQVNEVYN